MKLGSVRKIFSVLGSLRDASLEGEMFTDPSISRDFRLLVVLLTTLVFAGCLPCMHVLGQNGRFTVWANGKQN